MLDSKLSKKILTTVFGLGFFIIPLILEAQFPVIDTGAGGPGQTEPSNFKELVGGFLLLINQLIPIIFTLTFTILVFYVIKDWVLVGSDTSIEEGKKKLLIGIIALVVMSGVWGIVSLLRTSLLGQ